MARMAGSKLFDKAVAVRACASRGAPEEQVESAATHHIAQVSTNCSMDNKWFIKDAIGEELLPPNGMS